MSLPDVPLRYRGVGKSFPNTCDICGKPRGSRKINHDNCSKLRQMRSKERS